MAEGVLIASAVVGLIGAGVSAYGSYQSGKTQEAIASFNAQQQADNARMQARALETQAAMQRSQAEANFKLRAAEAAARTSNAAALEQQALTQDTINRQNLLKRREDFARAQGEQRAAIAASGVVESSGTPLDLLAEMAARIQQDQEEQHYVGELQRRTLFNEAAMERLGGQFALAGATLERDSAVGEAALRDASARATLLSGMREGQIMRLTGKATRQASTYQAAATLLSGTSSAAGTVAGTLYKPS